MTARALLYLLITLLIGFGLGMLSDRALMTLKRSKVAQHPPEHNIVEDMIRSLELDSGQVESIRPVLEEFFARTDSTRKMIMQQAGANMDSLRQNLIPFLTAEQIREMEESGFFRPGPWRQGKPGPPGPPPGGGRPQGPPPDVEHPGGPPQGSDHPPETYHQADSAGH
jgi:hypothetical protein